MSAPFERPTQKPTPNFANLLSVLNRDEPERPTLFEFFLNNTLYTELAGRSEAGLRTPTDRLHRLVAAFTNAGYDYATYHGSDIHFARNDHELGGFRMGTATMITDRRSFDAYAWPKPDDFDYSALTDIEGSLPEGLKLVVCGPGGVLENAIQLVGFETLCLLIADDPEFLDDVFAKIGSILVRHYEIAAPHETVGACISNDDWGFKTQSMISPDAMRRFVIPWHSRIAETIHRHGKPAILHSCGNQAELYEDIIETIGYDAKHSYEDAIQPVEDAYEMYHDRMAILGGIDLDFVCRAPPEEVFERSSAMLRRAAGRGGYALGTGNSVPEYVPKENYYAMTAAVLQDR